MPFLQMTMSCPTCGKNHTLRWGNPEISTPEHALPLACEETPSGAIRLTFRCDSPECDDFPSTPIPIRRVPSTGLRMREAIDLLYAATPERLLARVRDKTSGHLSKADSVLETYQRLLARLAELEAEVKALKGNT